MQNLALCVYTKTVLLLSVEFSAKCRYSKVTVIDTFVVAGGKLF